MCDNIATIMDRVMGGGAGGRNGNNNMMFGQPPQQNFNFNNPQFNG
jgi:hypothetical protein